MQINEDIFRDSAVYSDTVSYTESLTSDQDSILDPVTSFDPASSSNEKNENDIINLFSKIDQLPSSSISDKDFITSENNHSYNMNNDFTLSTHEISSIDKDTEESSSILKKSSITSETKTNEEEVNIPCHQTSAASNELIVDGENTIDMDILLEINE